MAEIKDFESLLTLNDSDFKMILEGLDALKSKDFGMDIMGMMLDSMVKPKADDIEGMQKWNIHKQEEELRNAARQIKLTKLKEEVDLLKAKIILVLDLARRQETKASGRQLKNK